MRRTVAWLQPSVLLRHSNNNLPYSASSSTTDVCIVRIIHVLS